MDEETKEKLVKNVKIMLNKKFNYFYLKLFLTGSFYCLLSNILDE